jgi:hypothetical protein
MKGEEKSAEGIVVSVQEGEGPNVEERRDRYLVG